MKLIRKIYEIGILYFNCIIITTISVCILNSCAAPRSVRPTGTHSSSNRVPIKQDYKEKKNDKAKAVKVKNEVSEEKPENIYNSDTADNNNQIEYAEPTAIAGLSSEETKNNEELPSLVQQLRMLNAGQEVIQKDIHEIKTSINDIDSRITKLENNNPQNKRDFASNNFNSNKKLKSKVILPDEALKTQPKKKFNSIPKVNYIPKREQENNAEQEEDVKQESVKDRQIVSNEQLKTEIDAIKSIVSKRDYSDAINRLTKMVEEVKDPVTLNVCNFYLGESHYGLRQYSKAIDYYEKVLNYGKTDKTDDALIGIAEAKFRLGNVSEAKEVYQKFMKSFPKSEHTPTARKMLQQI